jgi:hypothetical protein
VILLATHEDIILDIHLSSLDKHVSRLFAIGIQLEKQGIIYERTDWMCVVIKLKQLVHKRKRHLLVIKILVDLIYRLACDIPEVLPTEFTVLSGIQALVEADSHVLNTLAIVSLPLQLIPLIFFKAHHMIDSKGLQ